MSDICEKARDGRGKKSFRGALLVCGADHQRALVECPENTPKEGGRGRRDKV